MLDSDISNADSKLHVEFYLSEEKEYKDIPFVRIIVPGDKTNIVEQQVREDHKERFPRQWLYFQMKDNAGPVAGVPLEQWNASAPEELTRNQLQELQILKFQTVEQVATASDAQIQRVGMGAAGLRERARSYLIRKNKSEGQVELEETRKQMAAMQAQLDALLGARKPGRPPKTIEE